MATIQAEYERSFVMEQLDKYPVTDKEDKPRSEMSYKELIWLLAIYRAAEVKVESPHASWF